MNSPPIDLALLLGVGHAGEFGEEALAGVNGDNVQPELLTHGLLDLGELAFAQDAVVDEDAGEPVADGALRPARPQRTNRRRRRARRWRGRSRRPARLTRSIVDWIKCSGVQSGIAPQMPRTKLRSSSMPRRVCATSGWNCTAHMRFASLAMPAMAFSVSATSSKPGAQLRPPRRRGTSRRRFRLGSPAKRGVCFVTVTWAWPYSRLGAALHLATEIVRDELQPVADAQDGHAKLKQRGVGGGGVRVIDRAGSAGEDNPLRRERLDGCRAPRYTAARRKIR